MESQDLQLALRLGTMNKSVQELRYYHDTEDDLAVFNFSLDFHFRLANGWKLISHCEHEGGKDPRFVSAVWEKCLTIN